MAVIEPSEFDLIVLGTGLIESIIAAAASKSGKAVLQLDPNDHYGSSWASLHLDEFLAHLEASNSSSNGTGILEGIHDATIIHNQQETAPSSHYNIDLAPRVMYGAGPLIQLLLGSSAHHYLEFKLIQGNFIYDAASKSLRPVPSSRPEIFKNQHLGPLQKRSLMKFLKYCTDAIVSSDDEESNTTFDSRPFSNLMLEQGLVDAELQGYMMHGILKHTGPHTLSAREALTRLRVYGESLGRYEVDTGPFLTPLYGCGEVSQAFCRVAAVHGGVQMLRCPIQAPIFDEHSYSCKGLELETGQILQCAHLVSSTTGVSDWVSSVFKPTTVSTTTHHCVVVLDGQLIDGESQSMLVIPPHSINDNATAVHGLVLTHSTLVCPAGKCVLYLWCDGWLASSSPYDVLKPVVGQMLNSAKDSPSIQLEAYYSHTTTAVYTQQQEWPGNVTVCPGPAAEPTYIEAVDIAKELFGKMYPDIAVFPFDKDVATQEQEGSGDGNDQGDSDDETLAALRSAVGNLDVGYINGVDEE